MHGNASSACAEEIFLYAFECLTLAFWQQVVGITPARLMVLNKAAKLPSSMSAPLKSGDEGGNTLEDIVAVRWCSAAVPCGR